MSLEILAENFTFAVLKKLSFGLCLMFVCFRWIFTPFYLIKTRVNYSLSLKRKFISFPMEKNELTSFCRLPSRRRNMEKGIHFFFICSDICCCYIVLFLIFTIKFMLLKKWNLLTVLAEIVTWLWIFWKIFFIIGSQHETPRGWLRQNAFNPPPLPTGHERVKWISDCNSIEKLLGLLFIM